MRLHLGKITSGRRDGKTLHDFDGLSGDAGVDSQELLHGAFLSTKAASVPKVDVTSASRLPVSYRISICRLCCCGLRGASKVTSSTPSLKFAWAVCGSTPSGSGMLR